MIPLEVLMLALITFALLIVKLLPLALMAISAPLTVFAESAWQLVLLFHFSGHNMIGRDSGKLMFILGFEKIQGYDNLQRLRLWVQKNSKGPSPLSVSTRPAALTAVTRVFKTAGINRGIDNVFFGSTRNRDVIVTSEIMDVITFFMCFNLG